MECGIDVEIAERVIYAHFGLSDLSEEEQNQINATDDIVKG